MMGVIQKTSTLPRLSKNFLDPADQNWKDLILKFNASASFDATHGLGHDGTTTTAIFATIGGFGPMRVIADMKYRTPVATGSEDLGVVFRFRSIETGQQNFYFARLFHSLACLYKVVGNAYSLLDSASFVLAQDAWMTITCTADGGTLGAKFESTGLTTRSLGAAAQVDHAVGGVGLVSISCGLRCGSLFAEQTR